KVLFDADVADETRAVGHALEFVMTYSANPLHWLNFFQKLPTPGNFRYRRVIRELDANIYGIIPRRRDSRREADHLLGRLLAARDEDGSQMTDQQLRDELMTLFLAGHETTALALSYCFYLISQHPEIEAQLVAECERVLGDRPATSADVPQLRYTEWV